MTHEFELRKELSLDATPEQVWEAIATGPGIDSWFMGRSQVEPREGGTVRWTLGDQTQESTVTAWEPPKRFAVRGEGPDGSFMAFEWIVEGRDQGGTVLRLVQSGVLGDDWEAEYDALSRGWDMYLHTLAQCLTYFPGRTATPVWALQPEVGDRERAWTVLKGGLGLAGTIAEGDQVRLTPDGLPPIEGVVDYVSPDFVGVRTTEGLYRFVYGRGAVVVEHHVFADVGQQETEQAWQSWLTRLFA